MRAYAMAKYGNLNNDVAVRGRTWKVYIDRYFLRVLIVALILYLWHSYDGQEASSTVTSTQHEVKESV
jgi:hypothetical protein